MRKAKSEKRNSKFEMRNSKLEIRNAKLGAGWERSALGGEPNNMGLKAKEPARMPALRGLEAKTPAGMPALQKTPRGIARRSTEQVNYTPDLAYIKLKAPAKDIEKIQTPP